MVLIDLTRRMLNPHLTMTTRKGRAPPSCMLTRDAGLWSIILNHWLSNSLAIQIGCGCGCIMGYEYGYAVGYPGVYPCEPSSRYWAPAKGGFGWEVGWAS